LKSRNVFDTLFNSRHLFTKLLIGTLIIEHANFAFYRGVY